MLAKIFSGAVCGIDAYSVEIEVDAGHGEPRTFIVGLPDAAVKESEYRVETALINSGFAPPDGRTTVNLAPADIKKEGPIFDLPIAIGMLAATRAIKPDLLDRVSIVGELALSGKVRKVCGILPIVLAARSAGQSAIFVPAANVKEAAVVDGIKVFPIENLRQAADFLDRKLDLKPYQLDAKSAFHSNPPDEDDFEDVKGQEYAKRAIEVAVAGGHNLLAIGPPGTGKTMLARRIPSILPPMSLEESLEITKIHSIAGILEEHQALVERRPFRAPHHTISNAGLLGGGSNPRPGEVSLAHNGVLFLDELPEFQRSVLEVLRQPLENGSVTIARVAASSVFPSRLMLVASMNPCPCGYQTDPKRTCRCSTNQIRRYRNRISGPLLDRIDIHVEVPSVRYKDLSSLEKGEPSAKIRARVVAARKIQQERFNKSNKIHCNAGMGPRKIQRICQPNKETATMLKMAMTELQFSARAYDRILKVARTIADLDQSETIEAPHVNEAIQYRTLDRQLWN